MNQFDRLFYEALQKYTRGSSFRTDKVGNRVEIPRGGSYAVGKNGKGKGIRRGNTAREDDTGQIHDVPPGHTLKTGPDGKGVVVPAGGSTSIRNGKLVLNNGVQKVWRKREQSTDAGASESIL